LNYDTASHIARYLSARDVKQAKLACSKWNQAFDYNWNDADNVVNYVKGTAKSLSSPIAHDDKNVDEQLDLFQAVKNLRIAKQDPRVVASLVECGALPHVTQLLEQRPDPVVVTSAFLAACKHGELDLVKRMDSPLGDADAVGEGFVLASTNNHLTVAQHLLPYIEAMSNATQRTQYVSRAIVAALEKKHHDLAQTLAQQPAGQDALLAERKAFDTVVQLVAKQCHLPLLDWFVANGMDANFNNGHLLELSASENQTLCVDYLLQHGADVALREQGAFFEAVRRGALEVTQIFLAQPNLDIHKSGDKALWLAAMKDNIPMLQLLLEHGADIHGSRDYAIRIAPRKETVEFLVQHGADLQARIDEASELAKENRMSYCWRGRMYSERCANLWW
jgi:ankyrin repeat protein